MGWFKVHDLWNTHPRFAGLTDAAQALYFRGMALASAHATDGHLKRSLSHVMQARDEVVDELVEAGLWEVEADGWSICKYLEWNRSKAEREALSAKRSRAGKQGAATRAEQMRKQLPSKSQATENGLRTPDADADADAETTPLVSAAPTPKPEKPKRTPPNADLFEALCEVSRLDPKQLTRTAASGIGKCAKELAELGVSGDEVRQVARRYRREWPQAELTPHALAKHWGRFAIGQARQPDPDACGTCGFGPSEHDDLFCKQLQREVG